MTTFNELYLEMSELLSKYPEIGAVNICACGADSRLNIFRQEPDGPVTGVSLEDASYMEGHISYAYNLAESLGVSLSSQHMEYLIQMCMEEASEEAMEDFIKQYALPKKEADLLVYELEESDIKVYYSLLNSKFHVDEFSASTVGEIIVYIKNKYKVEVPWFEFVTGYFKKEFGVLPELSLYYIQKYECLLERAVKKADEIFDKEGVSKFERDYGEAIAVEELYANHDEVIGYYLGYYREDPLKGWLDNTKGLDLNVQDKKVQRTLQNMFGKRQSHEFNMPLKGKIDVAKEKTTSSKKNSTLNRNTINKRE